MTSKTFVAVSFFFDFIVLFLWIFYHFCVKNCVSCQFHLFVQYEHLTWRLRTCNLTVLSAKIEQSIVLIYNANHQVHNVLCDRKVNDLCRRFRYLTSWWHGENSYIVCTHLSFAVYTGNHIELDANNIYVNDITLMIFIGTSDLYHYRFQHTFRWES